MSDNDSYKRLEPVCKCLVCSCKHHCGTGCDCDTCPDCECTHCVTNDE